MFDAEKIIQFFKTAEEQQLQFPYVRPALEKLVPQDVNALEIGAGSYPLLNKNIFRNFKILDFYSTEELLKHLQEDYKWDYLKVEHIPSVDFVCKDGDIAAITQGQLFEFIYSSHALEHQPCLITHLRQLESCLAKNGLAVMSIPDKHCTFDYLRQTSTTSDVLVQFHLGKRRPYLKSIFDAHAISIDLNLGQPISQDASFQFNKDLEAAYLEFKRQLEPTASYQDVHNWVFTRNSFNIMMVELYLLGLTRLFPQVITRTIGNEFTCILKIVDNPSPDEIQHLKNIRLALYKTGIYQS